MGGQQSAAKDAAGQQPGDATSSSHGKGRAANNQVQLAVSPLGGVPGATAYHSSVIVNGDEYFFSDAGISFGSGLQSHKNPQNPDSKPEVFDMGMSPYTGTQMKSALERMTCMGPRDMSNTRLDKKYRAMEKLDRALLLDMDGYSSKKRAEDGICRLSLDAPHRLQQRSISASKLESMKHEAEMAKEWGKQVKAELHLQQGNAKALQKDTLASRSWGGPKYRHVPPQDGQSADYQKSMRRMQSLASEISTKQASVDKAMQEDYRMVRNTRADTSVHSLAAWLEKYGKPSRQPEQQERFRTTPFKQRRIPFLGISEAKTLRLGAGIWSQRSETDLLGTYNFRSVLVGRNWSIVEHSVRRDNQSQTHGSMENLRQRFSTLVVFDAEGASAMGIVQAASGGQYQPNPKAEGFDVEKVCDEIDPDKVWKTPGQATGGATVSSAEAMRAARLAKLGGPGAGPGPAPTGGYAEGQPGGAQPPPSSAGPSWRNATGVASD
ncbi:unnamed protein product [Symbiodinium necroappetens]|uniref:PPPDE domain-containing protein n=1 Tax=Symbiodinium necroappetens TaxID=1628268 RepID=A0A812TM56_9DINO|nr:unnamed protein product [Symbiodinium necroappetens]